MSSDKFISVMNRMEQMREERGLERNGTKYSQVKDRIDVFRREFGGDYGINVEVFYHDGFEPGAVIVAKAVITDGTGVVSAGHAMDRVGSTHITQTAIIESVETAAVGRALAFMGFGGGEFPSDSEMGAITRKQQAYQETVRPALPALNIPMTNGQGAVRDIPAVEANLDLIERRDSIRKYMPNDTTPFDLGVSKIADEVCLISDLKDLTTYWQDLKRFRDDLAKGEPALHSELLAIFATVKNGLASKGASS